MNAPSHTEVHALNHASTFAFFRHTSGGFVIAEVTKSGARAEEEQRNLCAPCDTLGESIAHTGIDQAFGDSLDAKMVLQMESWIRHAGHWIALTATEAGQIVATLYSASHDSGGYELMREFNPSSLFSEVVGARFVRRANRFMQRGFGTTVSEALHNALLTQPEQIAS